MVGGAPSCALLDGFAIGARVSLPRQRSAERETSASACSLAVWLVASCSVGLDYLACQQGVVSDICGARAALWQRNVTRLMMAAMPDDRSCFSYVFGQCRTFVVTACVVVTSFGSTRAVQPVAKCRQSPYLRPAIVIVASFSLYTEAERRSFSL